jgi:hypothetical protein
MNKEKKFTGELLRFHAYLQTHTASAGMVCAALGIYRPNGCRYVATLRKAGRLIVVKRDVCKITKFRADYLSCDSALVGHARQLSFLQPEEQC